MAYVDVLDPKLRSGVLSARANGHRCFKAVVDADPTTHMLKLEEAIEEEAGTSIAKEFTRCVAGSVSDALACMFLFRADDVENIEGSRWILVLWMPEAVPEGDRAVVFRSRALIMSAVPSPYFLQEYFARDAKSLTLAFARDAAIKWPSTDGSLTRPSKLVSSPMGPLAVTQAVQGLLERFARKEDTCIRVCFQAVSKLRAKVEGRGPPTLEIHSTDIRTIAQLVQGSMPTAPSYFAIHVKESLVFIFWCPDGMVKDTRRVMDDARYATLQSTVLRALLDAFAEGTEKPRVVRAETREAADIADAVTAATARSKQGGTKDAAGGVAVPGVIGPACAVPVTVAMPERPIPPWRGGSKANTIASAPPAIRGSHHGGATETGGNGGPSSAKPRVKINA